MNEKLFAFVLMPFSKKFEDVYNLGIKEAAKELDILAERVDEQIYSEGILDRIYRQIEIADIIIADMTGQNPNVFYEVGYAHAKEKLCILLTSDSNDIPFDLKHKRHIIYDNSIMKLKKSLIDELKWAKGEIETVQKSRVKITLVAIEGLLTKTKYVAVGNLTFKIDMQNESKNTSPDIEAIYIYSGPGWELFQDGKECPSRAADLKPYSLKHFVNPPIRRLQKGQWAQLVFNSKKHLAYSMNGENFKDSYQVNGMMTLELVTAEGSFAYELQVEAVVDEIPF